MRKQSAWLFGVAAAGVFLCAHPQQAGAISSVTLNVTSTQYSYTPGQSATVTLAWAPAAVTLDPLFWQGTWFNDITVTPDRVQLLEWDPSGVLRVTTVTQSPLTLTRATSGLWRFQIQYEGSHPINGRFWRTWTNIVNVYVPPPAPTLFAPGRTPVNGHGFLMQWTRSPADTIYELQEDTSSTFNAPDGQYWPTASQEPIPAKNAAAYWYRVRAWSGLPEQGGAASAWSNVASFSVMSDTVFLDLVARRTFDYFLASTHPNGLTRDRFSTLGAPSDVASTAATGFYLSALTVGAKRGWITTTAAAARARAALTTLTSGTPHVHGFLYHFLRPDGTPSDVPFREVSAIDTALLMAGALQAGEYFGGDIRTLADALYRRVEWAWMFDANRQLFRQAWTESGGFGGYYDGYSEGILLYLLAIGSPTSPVPAESFYSFHRAKGNYRGPDFIFTYGGQLFTYQYPHCWFDFRNKTDALGVNWWNNSIEAVRANQRFALDNVPTGYSQHLWGLTASDGPDITPSNLYGYKAYGALPAYDLVHDGTIAPTGIGASVPLAPDIAIPALKYLYGAHGDAIWQTYGFVDAFNARLGWTDTYYLGIDQGAILLMLENHRARTVWNSFMLNPHVRRALARTRFSGFVPSAVTLEDFEDGDFATPNTTFGWEDSDPGVYLRTHVTSPVFAGARAMQVQYAKNGHPYAFTSGKLSATNARRDFSSHSLLSVNVRGAATLLVKLRNAAQAEQDVAVLRASNPSGWNRLVFDYAKLGLPTNAIDRVMFFLAPGDGTAAGTVTMDQIRLETPSPRVVDNFEDGNFWTPAASLGWWDADGTRVYRRSQSKDPSHGGLGAMRIEYTKDGLPWSFMGGFIEPANPLRNFVNRSRLVVWVSGTTELLVKLRDRTFREAELGVARGLNPYGWTRLAFDYTGLTSINLADVDNILFFAEPGNPAASGVFYLDDLALE